MHACGEEGRVRGGKIRMEQKKPGRDKLAEREIRNLTNTLQGGREARNGRVRCKECGRQKKKLCKSGKASCENVLQKGNKPLGCVKYFQKPKNTYSKNTLFPQHLILTP